MTKGWGWVESVTLTSRGDFTAEGWGGGRVSSGSPLGIGFGSPHVPPPRGLHG